MICKKCKKITEDRCFATYKDKNGVKRRRGICKACRGQYAVDNFERLQQWRKNYNHNNKSEKRQKDHQRRLQIKSVIDQIKSAPCADCGKCFPPIAMDFDHVRGKNKGIAHFVAGAYKLDLILEEIKLCDIVCACCHRIRTHGRKQNHAPTERQKQAARNPEE